jgi:cytochrome c oxidase cbb3-type subunit 4
MLKDVVSKLDYSTFDEIALVIFALAFVTIIYGAFRLRSESTERFSSIPLSDLVQDPIKHETPTDKTE